MPGKPELLAPAGSWEALVAAVQNGADAVYLGGRSFNARQSAANFDDAELARAIEYAHVRGVKVYVTVNTLVAEEELEQAARFLFFLARAGADAAILQDLGLAALAREVVPELPLHASTQMTVHNSPAVAHLRRLGFQRVILARELHLAEVQRIKEETGAGVEVFIHGALCVCYSGQCLFSSLVGGRSGNRGRCAQPCRLPYTLVDGHGRPLADPGRVGEYLLSPRDLNVSRHLPALIQAGVDAFKIEGRLKRPEYVATVVRVYRQLLDRAAALGPEKFFVAPEEAKDLAQIFNREFTAGYLFGRQGKLLMSFRRPNNRGVFLGRVRRRENGWLQVVLEDGLNVGDGLEVWVTEGGRD
ncbi:MAG: peptidase U32 family protein, partial [Bacillota bacterium]